MKKVKATYEQAVAQYNTFLGKAPTVNEMNALYHKYAYEWKHFNGFTDWLAYNVD